MKHRYKNASKEAIFYALVELAGTNYSFQQPVLQGEIFWLYVNSRRYWGTYKAALSDVGIKLRSDKIKSELGHPIDWWDFKDGLDQRDWLEIVLKYLYGKSVDIKSKPLKDSPYFDLYTDAVLLFGKYSTALVCASIPIEIPQAISYPDADSIFKPIVNMYCCQDHETKCRMLKKLDSALEIGLVSLDHDVAQCSVIVDGANVAYIGSKPSLEHVKLIDNYLQIKGFRRDNITFIFDAAFRHKVNTEEFDEFMSRDKRYVCAPAGESADGHILTKALDDKNRNPGYSPYIISNDQYSGYFVEHPELEELRSRRKGVTWTFRLKKPEPVICFLRP
jgi:hypothetical protein